MLIRIMAISGLLFGLSFSTFAQDIVKGERYFKGNCFVCHGMDGMGIERKQTPRIAGQKAYYVLAQIKKFRSGKRPSESMKPTYDAMDEQDIKDVAAFLEQWR